MTFPQPSRTDVTTVPSDEPSETLLNDADTFVTYPRGDTANTATVLHVQKLGVPAVTTFGDDAYTPDATPASANDGRWVVLLDATSCHPVDAGWPDQGPDRAVLHQAASAYPVVDCVVAASDGHALYVGTDIPVRQGTAGWAFCVAHIVNDASALHEGDSVEVVVDAAYRRALSHGHTGCHLASLALNRALADRWSKEIRSDGLGQPDFDGAAIDSSFIVEWGSVDTYRLNKSLRRKGFSAENLDEALPHLAALINDTLAVWVDTDAAVRVEAEGPRLTDRRSWVCELPDATVRIPCGGTHAHSLAELGAVRVELTVSDINSTPTLTMTTKVTAA